jgi:hypothetical protein
MTTIFSRTTELVAAAVLFGLSVVLGVLGNAITAGAPDAERGVVLTGAIFGLGGALVYAAWLASRGWRLTQDAASFGVLAVALMVLVASYFAAELSQILYRADILIWSESPFVNDIIRFRAGLPLYGTPSDLSSFNYTPGSQLLTWWLASAVGQGESVPTMRVVQLVYVVAAVLIGVRAARRLRSLSVADPSGLPWAIVWVPLLFLAATNALTNPFAHLLHNDSLALLVCAAAFLVLVEYATAPRVIWLVAMVLLPPLGFLVKQSTAIWCVLFGAWLLFFDRKPRVGRALTVGGSGLLLTLLLYWGGLALWGTDFRYWVIEGLGSHAVSPLRSVQHALDAWAYWAAGLWSCWMLVRGDNSRVLLGLWLVWAALLAMETYTSGIAWMLNHMGPGSFIAIIWLSATLPSVWPSPREAPNAASWFRAGLATLLAILFMSGLRAIRVPVPSLSRDADRYASAIEKEFEGLPPDRVLLDHGSWIYLRHNVVQRDRSAPTGEAGYTQTADFSGLRQRLRTQAYAKIMVRELHEPEFMYDYWLWPVPSGLRDSLLAQYSVVRTIDGVAGSPSVWLRPISVLEPRVP